jgi:hypothetical protein
MPGAGPARRPHAAAFRPAVSAGASGVGKSTMLYRISAIEADTGASAGLRSGAPGADGIQTLSRDACGVASPWHNEVKPRFQCALAW